MKAVVVGDAAVTLRCAEILVARGHAVRGVVTGDGRVAGWAAGQGVACHFAPQEAPLTREDVLALTGGAPFDLLLSIHNLRILPGDVLSLPGRMAVNYHDALLPRYAGLHATTWAILAGERSHGITWHRMTEAVDAGEILLQRRFAVEPEDTAWTLNVRCAEAAVESFPELLARLAAGSAPVRSQNAANRTWFSGWRKPAPGCVVPWDAPAETVSAFVRALDFGIADNPLGLPKLLAPGGPVLLHSVDVLERRSGSLPGTVVASGPAGIEIATATHNVLIPLVAAHFGAHLGLIPGVQLPVEAPAAAELAARERSLRRQEGYWAAVLADLAPLAPPGFTGAAGGETAETVCAVPEVREDELLAAVLRFLAFEVGQPFDVALGEPELGNDGAFFAARLPIRIDCLEPLTLPGFAARLRQKRAELREHGTYAADLPARLCRLRGQPGEPAVAVDLLADGASPPPLGAATTLAVAISGRTITWRSPLAGADGRLTELAGRFRLWLVSSPLGGPRPQPRALPWAKETRPSGPNRQGQIQGGGGPEARVPLAQGNALGWEGGSPKGADTLIHLFQSQSARTPDSPALVAGGVSWTYRELAARVSRLASSLRQRGVGPERLVALRLERLPDLVTGMLGVLAAGGAFLVLDPLETPARTAHILAAARPALAVGDPGLHRLAPDVAVHPIAIADAPEGPEPAVAVSAAGWNLAYVAFTSGSSGVPKGVAVEQRAITHYIRAAGRRFGLGPGDRILQLGSPAFDLAFEQIFGTLCHGASLVGLDAPHLPATRELMAESARLGITVLDLPTAVWAQAVRDIKMLTLPLPPDLRLVVIGGEMATVQTLRDWRAGPGGSIRLINTYGPTETTIVATWCEAGGAVAEEGSLPIGEPVDGVEVWVLDPERRPVAPGEVGELWIGGAGLARGYHRRPDLTAERFQRVSAAGERRLYRTGDRVRERPDGVLDILGRMDRQIKLGGRRVEPEEVESVLASIPGVTVAAVAPVAQWPGAGRAGLVAWVTLENGAAIEDVRQEAARRLPGFLLPASILPVVSFPRTRAGKIDLQALEESLPRPPSPPGPFSRASHLPPAPNGRGGALADPPRGAVETRLAAIWERLLGACAVSRHDDFFELGGDSLAAVALLAEIEQAFGKRLPVARLVRRSTIAALAGEIGGPGTAEPASCLVTLEPGPWDEAAAPFVCVHGLGGHLLRLIPLARALAAERPMLGLQSPGLDDGAPIPSTIEDLARIFLAEMRLRIGAGPYLLGGMSFGGLVAFEMARQMAAEGSRPGLLALFDSDFAEVLPGFKPSPPSWSARLRGALRRAAGDRLGRFRRLARRLLLGQDQVHKANEYRHFTRVVRANDRALARYQPGPYDGTVTYFAATERDPALYQEFVRRTGCDLRIVRVPGDHLGMLDLPHVGVLAAELRQRMPDMLFSTQAGM